MLTSGDSFQSDGNGLRRKVPGKPASQTAPEFFAVCFAIPKIFAVLVATRSELFARWLWTVPTSSGSAPHTRLFGSSDPTQTPQPLKPWGAMFSEVKSYLSRKSFSGDSEDDRFFHASVFKVWS